MTRRRLIERTFGVAAFAIALGIARPASGQRLVEVESTPLAVSIDEPVAGLEESGALVAYGQAIGRGAVALRVDATSVHEEPGLPRASATTIGVEGAIACGGRRWLLEYEERRTRFSVRASDGVEVWGREFSRESFPTMRLQCAGSRAMVGWVESGELVTVAITPTAEHRMRIWGARDHGDFEWVARSADEIYAVVRPWGAYATAFHFVLGGIAHRQSLGAAVPGELAITHGRLLVSTSAESDGTLSLRSLALDDLAPVSAATIAITPRRASARCMGLWSLTPNLVVAAVTERWEGPDAVTIPGTAVGGRPPRAEPALHRTAGLYAWNPGSGAVGPRFELDSRTVGAGSVIAGRVVLVQPVEPNGVVAGVVQLRSARLRRFALAP